MLLKIVTKNIYFPYFYGSAEHLNYSCYANVLTTKTGTAQLREYLETWLKPLRVKDVNTILGFCLKVSSGKGR